MPKRRVDEKNFTTERLLRDIVDTEKITYHYIEKSFEENGDCHFNFNGTNSSTTPSGTRSLELKDFEDLSLLSLYLKKEKLSENNADETTTISNDVVSYASKPLTTDFWRDLKNATDVGKM